MNSLAIDLAKYLILISILGALYLLRRLEKHRRNFFILLVAGGILSILLAKIAGKLYSDPRPFIKDGVVPLIRASRDNGFPSEHTLLASLIGFSALVYSKKLGVALLIIAAFVGWARVYSGVHHLVDIVGSFAITAISTWLVYRFIKKYGAKAKATGPDKAQS